MLAISDSFLDILKLKNELTLVSILAITFSGNRVYGFTTAPSDQVINGRVFSSDNVMSITPPKTFGNITRDVYEIALSAELISLSSGSFFQALKGQPNGAVMSIKVYVLDPVTYTYKDNLFLDYGGFTAGFILDGNIIRIRSTGDLVKLGAIESRVTTASSQKTRFNLDRFKNDTGFDQIGQEQDILKRWGG